MLVNRRLGYGMAALIVVLACIAAGVVIVGSARTDLTAAAEAFSDRTQYMTVPGAADLELSRSGAYAVYYLSSYRQNQRPPELDCSLTARQTGTTVPLSEDYVPTRVSVGGRNLGVLIYSATVGHPGMYSMSCQYADGQPGQAATLAVGPNYLFEFLRGAWSVGRSLLGGLALICGGGALALFVVVVALLQSRARSRAAVAQAA